MNALKNYCFGFLGPLLAVVCCIWYENSSNDWFGSNPFYKLIPVLVIFLMCIIFFFLIFYVLKFTGRRVKDGVVFFCGLIGGLSLIVVPHLTANFLSGFEIEMLFLLAIVTFFVAWGGSVQGLNKIKP